MRAGTARKVNRGGNFSLPPADGEADDFTVTSRGKENEPPPPAEPPPRSFAVGHDGKIDGIYRPRDQRRTWKPDDDARLELAARPVQAAPVELPRPRRAPASPRKHVLAIAVILLALALPLGVSFGLRQWKDYKLRTSAPRGLLVIDSAPSGARVFIENVEVGRTPYVVPNTFQPGLAVPVRIVYPGAQEWTGTFPGGVDTSFTAELQAQ